MGLTKLLTNKVKPKKFSQLKNGTIFIKYDENFHSKNENDLCLKIGSNLQGLPDGYIYLESACISFLKGNPEDLVVEMDVVEPIKVRIKL